MNPIRELPYWPAAMALLIEAGQMTASDYVPKYPKLPLASKEAFSNRASLVKPASSSLSGSWFSPRSARAAATSGPVGKARVLQGPQRADITRHAHGP
jgi:hypothetical protein